MLGFKTLTKKVFGTPNDRKVKATRSAGRADQRAWSPNSKR